MSTWQFPKPREGGVRLTCLARFAPLLRSWIRLSAGREHARQAVTQPARDGEGAAVEASSPGESKPVPLPTSLELAVEVQDGDELECTAGESQPVHVSE